MIGQIVNYRYEVLEKVGDGALFSVYKSRDKVLNRLVALKVLSKELSGDADFASALREGYQSAAALDHPALARVFESDTTDGQLFVACEFVRGTSVKERLRRTGPMSVALALDVVIPVLEALEYAHANRIVHGDLRPQDIIVSPDGEVKLTDFGLSAALRAAPQVADRFAMRSVHYAAPEIAEGAPPTVYSDLYSVGAVLYEMLTGVVPFGGATAVAVALRQAKELPAPPRSINTGVPKSLSDLVMRAIEKNPADRFPGAAAMLADLRAIRDALRVGRPLSISQPAVTARSESETYASPPEQAEPSLKKPYLLLMVLFVVVFLASLGIAMYFVGERGKVALPALLGCSLEEAQAKAKEAGLQLIAGEEVYDENYDEGKICGIYQETEVRGVKQTKTLQPGETIAVDSVILARISKGPGVVAVPDLVGLPEVEANRAAADAKFTIGKVTGQYSDTIPVNSVISQKPDAGSMRPRGSAISIVVSLGVKPGSTESDGTASGEQERRFDVAVEVPNDADGSQEVRIVVDDTRGETVAYRSYHEPGDQFTQPVSVFGSPARIRVYVGGDLVSDDNY